MITVQIKHRYTRAVLFELTTAHNDRATALVYTLEQAVKQGANLSYADLPGEDLRGANIPGAHLAYANLAYSDLSFSNHSYANLIGADITHTNFTAANTHATLFSEESVAETA